jgi:DUF1680 family protein
MYVTGGIGSLPLTEGFGRDYELNPENAYAETCAALGSMLWSHEMALLTGSPRYSELFEWQLYNAAAVGFGMDGCSYFFNNPLTSRGNIARAGWYDVPCCPSNLSRIWASLGTKICSYNTELIRIHHYISSEIQLDLNQGVKLKIESGLPWNGEVNIKFDIQEPIKTRLELRLPAWSEPYEMRFNGNKIVPEFGVSLPSKKTANGLDLNSSKTLFMDRNFQPGDVIHLNFSMLIQIHKQDWRVPKCGGQSAFSRGPIVYCLESLDNTTDIFKVRVDPTSLIPTFDPEILGGTWTIKGKSLSGETLTWIPYAMWGNRGKSLMTVFSRIN